MILALGCLLLGAAAGVRGEDAREERRAAAALERRVLLQRALLDAAPQARERALAAFDSLRGVPAAYAPPLDVLAAAWHAAAADDEVGGVSGDASASTSGDASSGEADDRDATTDEPPATEAADAAARPAPRSDLQRLVDALHLRCVPGAFEPSDAAEDRRQPITVYVAPLYVTTPPREALEIALHWIGPDGQRLRARREPIDASAIRGPGFEMYVHAPASAPGAWRLVPELSTADAIARGIPALVECIEHPRERIAALEATDARAAWIARGVLDGGVRDPRGITLSALLSGAGADLAAPFTLPGFDPAGREIVGIEPSAGGEPPRVTLVAVAPDNEQADWLFAGAALARWREVAESERVRVLSTDLPCHAESAPTVRSLVAALRAADPDAAIVLLARGPAMSDLTGALRRDPETFFDACVQSANLARGARPAALAPRPTLFVEVLADEASAAARISAEGETPLDHAKLVGPPLWADLELPAVIAAWLRSGAAGDR